MDDKPTSTEKREAIRERCRRHGGECVNSGGFSGERWLMPGCSAPWSLESAYLSAYLDLRDEVERIRLERERLRAANSVHMQTLAILSKQPEVIGQAGRQFAVKRKGLADSAMSAVRLEDCVTVTLNDS